MNIHFLILARDGNYLNSKIKELKSIGIPYIIVCGEKINNPNIIYREPKGKYDAINYGVNFIPKDTDIVILNDVDTKIYELDYAIKQFYSENTSLVFSKVNVKEGPQTVFYKILDNIRNKLLITASGELMLISYKELLKIVPIKPCKAEDTYILFKLLEKKKKAVFCTKCYVETERTKTIEEEEHYKRRTVCGIYQALSYTRPPLLIKTFYYYLPFFSPFLMVTGKKGYYWMRGILLGLYDYLRGDQSGTWKSIRNNSTT